MSDASQLGGTSGMDSKGPSFCWAYSSVLRALLAVLEECGGGGGGTFIVEA